MHELIERAAEEKRNLLEPEALEVFRDYGLPVPAYRFVETAAEAVEAAGEIGFPVVMKVVSPDVVHKSDAGGVRTGLTGKDEVGNEFSDILRAVGERVRGADIRGALVVSEVSRGLECIVGMTRDAQFGPALMFGLGGVFVEVLKDVSFRILPLTREDAEHMISEIRGYRLLRGMRNQPPGDIPALVDFLLATGRMVEENPAVREIDINPLSVLERGVLALDARVILK